MRSIGFGTKATFITLSFMVPLLYLGWVSFTSMQAQIGFTRQERSGVAAMQHYVPVMHGILKARNASRTSLGGLDRSLEYGTARAEVDKALGQFQQDLAQSGDTLNLRAHVTALQKAWADTAQVPNGVDDKGRTVFGPVTRASITLLKDIGDNSKLMLDPDVDSFYMATSLIFTLPRLTEEIGQLWGWSSFAVAKGGLDLHEFRRYAVWDAGAARGIEEMHSNLDRAIQASPPLKDTLQLARLQQALRYREKVAAPSTLIAAALTPEEVYALGSKELASLVSFYDSSLPALDALLAEREQHLVNARNAILLVAAIFILVALYLFYCFYLVTQGGLRLISQHLQEMAAGDLRRGPSLPWGKDEPALLINDLRKAYESLHKLILNVRRSATELDHAAGQISNASQELSSRTEAAAATLEQQAATMEEIGANVNHTAEHAQEASGTAQRNAAAAERGGKVIASVVQVMSDIHTASQKIGEITGVIDGIAFQTNILALNAAVEAARAGEQGRGFAVVAAEVRALAQRSAAAAKEITTLITDSVAKADQGASVVRQAGDSMQELLGNARQISQLLTAIASSAQEEALGVEQAGQAIQHLDRDTQQNTAMVGETTATAQRLKEQADSLLHEISNFQLA